MGPTPLLTVRDLVRERRQADSRFILHVPALTLSSGQFIAVVGESGCGKSTLLDLLALVLKPDRCRTFVLDDPETGTIDLNALWQDDAGQALADLRATRYGYVLQAGGLLPFLTVEDNIRLPARITGRPLPREVVRDAAVRLGIGDMLGRKPRYLSGGQRQRAAILRAILHQPRLVLADEPTAAVDKGRARAIVAALHDLAQAGGISVVMVTHDLDLVHPYADQTFEFDMTAPDQGRTVSVCRPRHPPPSTHPATEGPVTLRIGSL